MRDFSKISPTVWRSRKFKSLGNDSDRLLYLYFLTNQSVNSAGCYDITIGSVCGDLKWSQEAVSEGIDRLSKALLIEWDEHDETVLIVNWERFNQPTNPKHAMGILLQIEQASSMCLKTKAFHAFVEKIKERGFDTNKDLAHNIKTLSKGYPKSIATRPDQSETEKERETRPDLDQTRPVVSGSERAANGSAAAPDGAAEPSPDREVQKPPEPFPEIPEVLRRSQATDAKPVSQTVAKILPREILNKIDALKIAGVQS